MALGRFLKSNNISRKRPTVSVRSMPKTDTGPKNGPMIIGVISTIAVMVALTFINIRLLSAPTPVNEPINQAQNAKKINPVFPEASSKTTDSKTCQAPTEVTFYSQLKTKEDRTNHLSSGGHTETRSESTRPETRDHQSIAPTNSKELKNFSLPASSGQSAPNVIENDHNPGSTPAKPGNDLSKGFIVQIGAFSHPRIAQEWASKWKAKGYKVSLKPVARPSSGIIYRLYLGDFESEKKADEFVKHLKAKEGITAMRLNARD